LNQMTGEIFKAEDLLPGNIIKVYNHELEILDCDEYTKKMIADPEARSHKFDLQAIMEKMREGMRQQFPLVRDIFRRFDTDHDGVVTLPEFKKALEKFGFMLADEEAIQIMKHFDAREDGQISYNEFCDAVLDEDWTTTMLKTKPPLEDGYDASYGSRAVRKSAERLETDSVRKAVRELGDVVYKRMGFQQRLFKEFSHLTHLSTVTVEQIQYALAQLGQSFDVADVTRAVLYIMPKADLRAIPYVEYFRALNAAFHDLSCCR